MLAACNNRAIKPGESYHVMRETGVTCRHAYMYDRATEKTYLAFCTSCEDKTSTDREQHQAYTKHIPARRNSSEGLPNDMCETSAVIKFS